MSDKAAADLLRNAADLLRHTGDHATPGPWRDLPMGSDGSVVLAGGNTIRTARRPARCGEFADASWIALANPLIAGPLAALMEEAASDIDHNGAHPFKYGNAISIATAIVSRPDTEETPA